MAAAGRPGHQAGSLFSPVRPWECDLTRPCLHTLCTGPFPTLTRARLAHHATQPTPLTHLGAWHPNLPANRPITHLPLARFTTHDRRPILGQQPGAHQSKESHGHLHGPTRCPPPMWCWLALYTPYVRRLLVCTLPGPQPHMRGPFAPGAPDTHTTPQARQALLGSATLPLELGWWLITCGDPGRSRIVHVHAVLATHRNARCMAVYAGLHPCRVRL
jgi:hypothetical protein